MDEVPDVAVEKPKGECEAHDDNHEKEHFATVFVARGGDRPITYRAMKMRQRQPLRGPLRPKCAKSNQQSNAYGDAFQRSYRALQHPNLSNILHSNH